MKRAYLTLLCLSLCLGKHALACDEANKVPDFDCSGAVQVTVLGDSLVVGFGDTAHNDTGGYILRAQRKLPAINFVNEGELGLKTRPLIQKVTNAFKRSSEPGLKQHLLDSDIVILDLGRNDRWLFGLPSEAYRNLKRTAAIVKSEVKKLRGTSPMVVIAVMMLPNRGSQGPWVKELNELILKGSSASVPADLRFDLVSKRLLGTDQIHPTPAGYDKLSKTLIAYLVKKLAPRMRSLRPDTDGDEIPDVLEQVKFGTDPTNPDTDGDSLTDGAEVFTLHSDPLTP